MTAAADGSAPLIPTAFGGICVPGGAREVSTVRWEKLLPEPRRPILLWLGFWMLIGPVLIGAVPLANLVLGDAAVLIVVALIATCFCPAVLITNMFTLMNFGLFFVLAGVQSVGYLIFGLHRYRVTAKLPIKLVLIVHAALFPLAIPLLYRNMSIVFRRGLSGLRHLPWGP